MSMQRDSCNRDLNCALTLIGQVEPFGAGLAFGGEADQDLVGSR